MISLVIGDGHALFRDAVQVVLQQHGFRICATEATTTATLAQLRFHRPDVCLLDGRFPEHDETDAVAAMRAGSPDTAVLVLGEDHEHGDVSAALAAGARGYLPKTRRIGTLVSAIRRIHAGERVVDLPPQRGHADTTESGQAKMLANHLTTRERECLAMLVAGRDTAAISAALGVSPTTVRTHVQAVLTKLGVHSRLAAATFAVRHRLVDESPGTGLATAL